MALCFGCKASVTACKIMGCLACLVALLGRDLRESTAALDALKSIPQPVDSAAASRGGEGSHK